MSSPEQADNAPVVVITGAGKGLGRAYAHLLGKRGARVIVNNRSHAQDREHSADRVVTEIQALGGEACAHYGEVENPDTGLELLELALSRYGRLDAVIANAGVSEGRSFHKQELADFARVVAINLDGTVNLLHPIFRHFYEQRAGAILVSTSAAGLYGEHGLPAYSASKAAVIGLMHALAHEGAAHGIRVNALAPFAATQMTADDLPQALNEVMDPARVAPVAAWLVDPACTLNGEILVCAAGRLTLARYLTTALQSHPEGDAATPEVIGAWWQQQEAAPEHHYNSALTLFRAFIRPDG